MTDKEVGFRCPACGARTEVHKTKSKPDKIRRKRHCLNPNCGTYFGTIEIPVEKSPVTPAEQK